MEITENRLSRNKMWCAIDIHNYMCHIGLCAKGFLDSNFDKAGIGKISFFFTKLPQILNIHKNRVS